MAWEFLEFLNGDKKKEQELKSYIFEAAEKYKRLFSGAGSKADAEWVLKDLCKRSFENTTTYDPDVKKMCINEGRRSLYKHILTMVNKDTSEILKDLTVKE